ncbi:MAG: ComEC/Rec2 family competence protein, partial [Alphaproteobacteria bacterium]|nr:ComEC/Rec2 family competence protein [Alphaproteobacteria bacterium]
YGPVEGRIVAIDRSQSGAVRLTLDRVVLFNTPPDRTPERVRISLHGEDGIAPEPGLTVLSTAHLSPPGGPVEPGGFDFRRHAWFQGIGAIGYTRLPLMGLRPPDRGLGITKMRRAIAGRVQAGLPGAVGGFGAAILTGDRSGLTPDTLFALRASNLAHLLAISGLHMGLLAGFVFATLRLAALAARIDGRSAKRAAAIGALLAAFGYLLISGGNVATERAFIMVAVALTAVLFDRRALSLRAVALAATIVLLLRPEALLGPGFQMSFAATTALVVVFRQIWPELPTAPAKLKWTRPVLALVVSSAVAGAATAPVGLAHFNQVAHYGLPANLLSVPLMGLLVIPAGVVALCLMPLGWEAPALWVMGRGLAWIDSVANWISELPGAVGHVPSAPPQVLPLLALGALLCALWQGRTRFVGVPVMAAGLAIWGMAERPDVLISEDGRLVGVMSPGGRALSKPKGQGFVALSWLENDGDPASQEDAALRWTSGSLPGGGSVLHVNGKRALGRFAGSAAGGILLASHDMPAGLPCRVIDPGVLKNTGAVALVLNENGAPRLRPARRSKRLWDPGQ